MLHIESPKRESKSVGTVVNNSSSRDKKPDTYTDGSRPLSSSSDGSTVSETVIVDVCDEEDTSDDDSSTSDSSDGSSEGSNGREFVLVNSGNGYSNGSSGRELEPITEEERPVTACSSNEGLYIIFLSHKFLKNLIEFFTLFGCNRLQLICFNIRKFSKLFEKRSFPSGKVGFPCDCDEEYTNLHFSCSFFCRTHTL